MKDPIRIYSYPLSGHAHKIRLFASVAGIEHQVIHVDLAAGEHKQAAYLSINPFGQVPAIQDGEVTLADSNAILVYLATRYAPQYLPSAPKDFAEVQRFLSIAAGDLAFGPAAARLVTLFGAAHNAEQAIQRAHKLFEKLENHLKNRPFLVADRITIADIALYTYTALAPEGNIDLKNYQHLRHWLKRIESLDDFIAMQSSAVGLAA